MLNELRERMAAYLAMHRVGVLSVAGSEGVQALPVRYRSRGLEVECLVPRWADAAYWLEAAPAALLIIESCHAAGLRWLAYWGAARPVDAPDWAALLPNWRLATPPDHIYRVFRVTPRRIDLFDESKGWGERETLEP
ncbi:MAG: hypothetical protein D6775_01355 [Caldilineae bacterium]|nr:MAG: hypothetical protein D6775_01355 [Caldilineae bacterium]